MKTHTSTVKDDIPAKLLKEFAPELSDPLAHIMNSMLTRGEYPTCWKLEVVTPAPYQYWRPKKISGLKNLSKIAEKMIGQFVISDMSDSRDKSQYGNQKKMGVNHYLITMIHEILVSVDSNSHLDTPATIGRLKKWP